MKINEALAILKKHGDITETKQGQWKTHCPAHDDERPSLSICAGKDKMAVFHCHSGCKYQDIIKEIKKMSNRAISKKAKKKKVRQKKLKKLKAAYQLSVENFYTEMRKKVAQNIGVNVRVLKYFGVGYDPNEDAMMYLEHDADKNIVGLTRRYMSDKPKIRFKNTGNRGIYTLCKRPRNPKKIYICEGLTDCLSVLSLYISDMKNIDVVGRANVNHNLSMDYITEYLVKYENIQEIVIVADSNDIGDTGSLKLANRIVRGCPNNCIKIIYPPDDYKDIRQAINAGLTKEEMDEIIDNAESFTPDSVVQEGDIQNGRMYAERFSESVRFNYNIGRYLIYDGKRWSEQRGQAQIMKNATELVDELIEEYKKVDVNSSEELLNRIKKLQSRERLRAMIEMAKHNNPIESYTSDYDQQVNLFNVANGTLNLDTFELQPHNSDNMISRISDVNFDINARFSPFDKFMKQVTDENKELEDFLYRAAGYSLYGGVSGQDVFFFLKGITRTGKSTFLGALASCFDEYSLRIAHRTLLKKRYATSGASPEIAAMSGVRLVCADEVPEDSQFDEQRIKALTGGNVIRARHLYKEEFEFSPQMTIWFDGNTLPEIGFSDEAMWERLIVIPFNNKIPPKERNPELRNILHNDPEAKSAFLAKAVIGLKEYQKRGLDIPDIVTEATKDCRQEQNPVASFIKECCVEEPGAKVDRTKLYLAYQNYQSEFERKKSPLSNRQFFRYLEAQYGKVVRKKKGYFYFGLKLR